MKRFFRVALAIVASAIATYVVAMTGGYFVLQGMGCAAGTGKPLSQSCVFVVQIIPLIFVGLWIATSVFLVRAFK